MGFYEIRGGGYLAQGSKEARSVTALNFVRKERRWVLQ